MLLSSCGEYNKLLSNDYEYGRSGKNYLQKVSIAVQQPFNELIAILKGTDKAEESHMLGMSYYNQKDYQTAAQTFIQYYNVYPRGDVAELPVFMPRSLFLDNLESIWISP